MRCPRTTATAYLLMALMAACTLPVAPTPAPAQRAPLAYPEPLYLDAAARGEPVFRVDARRSQLVVYVYRGGTFARAGHDHVLASRELGGYVHLPPAPAIGQADLTLALDTLQVDEPALRARAGFVTEPSAVDIAATRRNMLDKVLETARFPLAVVHVGELRDGPAAPVLNATLTLHGVQRPLRLPVEFERMGDTLVVSGGFSLRQSDFGITPFSVLGGALKVEDQLDLRFRVHAARVAPP